MYRIFQVFAWIRKLVICAGSFTENVVTDCAPEIKRVQEYPDLVAMVHATQSVLQDLVRYIDNFSTWANCCSHIL